MKCSFYVIDDLRLGYDPTGVTGWRFLHFLDWADALVRYRSLPASGVKELGLSNGDQKVSLVQCLPCVPHGSDGEDILVGDYFVSNRGQEDLEITEIAQELVEKLKIRYWKDGSQIVPAPKPMSEYLKDKYLWGDKPGDWASAVKWVYVAGIGWISPSKLQELYPTPGKEYRYPLILKYRADGVTDRGKYAPLELTPWEYKQLAHRTKKRIDQNK